MPHIRLQKLIDHFDERADDKTGAVGLVSRTEGEWILWALLTDYLAEQGWRVEWAGRPHTTVDGGKKDLDDLLACDRGDERQLLSVEYKFWTASSIDGSSVLGDGSIEEVAYAAWHANQDAWKGPVSRDVFLSWGRDAKVAKVLGTLDRNRLKAGLEGRVVQPVLAVWTPFAASLPEVGGCWTEANLAGDWHKAEGYGRPLAVFSGSLYARTRRDRTVEVPSAFGATISHAMTIVKDLIGE